MAATWALEPLRDSLRTNWRERNQDEETRCRFLCFSHSPYAKLLGSKCLFLSFFRKRHFVDLWHPVPLLCQRSLFFDTFWLWKIKKRALSLKKNWRKVGFFGVFWDKFGFEWFWALFLQKPKWLFFGVRRALDIYKYHFAKVCSKIAHPQKSSFFMNTP